MWRFAAIAIVLAARLGAGPACISGNNLQTYIDLGSGGCAIGSLVVSDFTFSVVSSGGGATPIAATAITVTTDFGASSFGISLGSAGFSVTGAQFVNYQIGYTWDPTGDLRGLGDVLDPGTADIITDGCVGVAFSGLSCSGTPVSVEVTGAMPNDFVAFAQTNILGVLDNISLNANGGSASFNGLESDAYVPEPGSFTTVVFGLILLTALFRIVRQFGFESSPKLRSLRNQR